MLNVILFTRADRIRDKNGVCTNVAWKAHFGKLDETDPLQDRSRMNDNRAAATAAFIDV